MALIETVSPEDAEGRLATLYRGIEKARGGVAAVHAVHSLHPRALQAHMRLYDAVVLSEDTSLSRVMRERIAVLVSSRNRCMYCIAHHAEALGRLGDAEDIVEGLRNGTPAGLPPREVALLEWASRGTVAPAGLGGPEVEALREHGWSDRDLLDASLTTAYFNFVNRVVLMLGVELEDGFEDTCGPSRDEAPPI